MWRPPAPQRHPAVAARERKRKHDLVPALITSRILLTIFNGSKGDTYRMCTIPARLVVIRGGSEAAKHISR